ncbi:hypothetical protein MO987_23615 [Vibrio vulnificus]|nr:hypothetical protein [Vibrio vulnificus]MCJ0807035.1 hypothetical protein [Vibrio vulnificus]
MKVACGKLVYAAFTP